MPIFSAKTPVKSVRNAGSLLSQMLWRPFFKATQPTRYTGPVIKYTDDLVKNTESEILKQLSKSLSIKKGKLMERIHRNGVDVLREIKSAPAKDVIDDMLKPVRGIVKSFEKKMGGKTLQQMQKEFPEETAKYLNAKAGERGVASWVNSVAGVVNRSHAGNVGEMLVPASIPSQLNVAPFIQSVQKAKGITGALPKKVYFGPGSAFKSPSYASLKDELYLTTPDPSQVLHEFTHAKDLSSWWRKAPHLAARQASDAVFLATPVTWAFGQELKDAIPGTYDDKAIDFLREYGPEVGLGLRAFTYGFPEYKAHRSVVDAASSGKLYGGSGFIDKGILNAYGGGTTASQAAANAIRRSRENLATYAMEGMALPYVASKAMRPLLDKESAVNPYLMTGLLGAGLGGVAGAVFDEDQRLRGAAIGAGLGGLLGTGASAALLHGKPSPVPSGALSQAQAGVADPLAKTMSLEEYKKGIKGAVNATFIQPFRKAYNIMKDPVTSFEDILFQNAAIRPREFNPKQLATSILGASLVPAALIGGTHMFLSPEAKQVMVDSNIPTPRAATGTHIQDITAENIRDIARVSLMEDLL